MDLFPPIEKLRPLRSEVTLHSPEIEPDHWTHAILIPPPIFREKRRSHPSAEEAAYCKLYQQGYKPKLLTCMAHGVHVQQGL